MRTPEELARDFHYAGLTDHEKEVHQALRRGELSSIKWMLIIVSLILVGGRLLSS